jgi:hypothetical protein
MACKTAAAFCTLPVVVNQLAGQHSMALLRTCVLGVGKACLAAVEGQYPQDTHAVVMVRLCPLLLHTPAPLDTACPIPLAS